MDALVLCPGIGNTRGGVTTAMTPTIALPTERDIFYNPVVAPVRHGRTASLSGLSSPSLTHRRCMSTAALIRDSRPSNTLLQAMTVRLEQICQSRSTSPTTTSNGTAPSLAAGFSPNNTTRTRSTSPTSALAGQPLSVNLNNNHANLELCLSVLDIFSEYGNPYIGVYRKQGGDCVRPWAILQYHNTEEAIEASSQSKATSSRHGVRAHYVGGRAVRAELVQDCGSVCVSTATGVPIESGQEVFRMLCDYGPIGKIAELDGCVKVTFRTYGGYKAAKDALQTADVGKYCYQF
ncbi:hypothetical protein LTR62_000722 [Meristemomyces frigidus]|uniref:Uncharacterized protein n=1 Tax=Meristemomyces frigidus TaxID=1508187 RepID=A0AAN7T927_9PEZI|nr:hypothetical protein LTR62_000722 [Meristemomyces frigidus]